MCMSSCEACTPRLPRPPSQAHSASRLCLDVTLISPADTGTPPTQCQAQRQHRPHHTRLPRQEGRA